MRLTWLFWYASGALTLLYALAMLSTFTPEAERMAQALRAGMPLGAAGTAGVAMWLGRLPAAHWVHRSRALWAVAVVACALVTLSLVAVG
jgi:hypothetical protein